MQTENNSHHVNISFWSVLNSISKKIKCVVHVSQSYSRGICMIDLISWGEYIWNLATRNSANPYETRKTAIFVVHSHTGNNHHKDYTDIKKLRLPKHQGICRAINIEMMFSYLTWSVWDTSKVIPRPHATREPVLFTLNQTLFGGVCLIEGEYLEDAPTDLGFMSWYGKYFSAQSIHGQLFP